MSSTILLHLGAHKTGTTYIQQTLAKNIPALRSQDVGFARLKRARSTVTKAVNRRAPRLAANARELLDETAPKCSHLILSDENLAGGLYQLFNGGRLYSNMEERLQYLRTEILREKTVRVFFCIRRFDEFIPSAHAEVIKHRPFFSLNDIAISDFDRVSWVPVLQSIANVFGAANVTAWDFSQFKTSPSAVCSLISGVDESVLTCEKGVVRKGFSQKTMDALEALRPLVGDEDLKLLMGQLSNAFPSGGGEPSYQPLSADLRQRLADRYAQDLADLQKLGIHWWTGAQPVAATTEPVLAKAAS